MTDEHRDLLRDEHGRFVGSTTRARALFAAERLFGQPEPKAEPDDVESEDEQINAAIRAAAQRPIHAAHPTNRAGH